MAEQIGKYTLKRQLATGGMAEIWLSEQRGPGGFAKELVIKRILPHLASDAKFVEMFLDEARLAAQLSHPNIVQIFDLGESDGQYFIAMEYIKGHDLEQILAQSMRAGRPLDPAMACRICADACAALDYAHNFCDPSGVHLKLVHRDVSPQNILVGERGVVKLVDFGVAKAATSTHKTQTGAVKGKFAYMSPEQIQGRPLDQRSDIFAMGIVFYELITGRRPFGHESELMAVTGILHHQPPPPREIVGDLDENLERIALSALEKDPAQRLPSADAMMAELEQHLINTGRLVRSRDVANYVAELFGKKPKRPVGAARPPGQAQAYADTVASGGGHVAQRVAAPASGPSQPPRTPAPASSPPQTDPSTRMVGPSLYPDTSKQVVVRPVSGPAPAVTPATGQAAERSGGIGAGLVIALILIVGLIGAGGYFVYDYISENPAATGVDAGSEGGPATAGTGALASAETAAQTAGTDRPDAGSHSAGETATTAAGETSQGRADAGATAQLDGGAGATIPQAAGAETATSPATPPDAGPAVPSSTGTDASLAATQEALPTLPDAGSAVALPEEADLGAAVAALNPPDTGSATAEPSVAETAPPSVPDAGAAAEELPGLPAEILAHVDDEDTPPTDETGETGADEEASASDEVEPGSESPSGEETAETGDESADEEESGETASDEDRREDDDEEEERPREDEPGYLLVVVTTPGRYRVFLDGEEIARTPMSRYRIAPGRYEVRVENLRTHEEKEDTVRIRPGRTATPRFSFD